MKNRLKKIMIIHTQKDFSYNFKNYIVRLLYYFLNYYLKIYFKMHVFEMPTNKNVNPKYLMSFLLINKNKHGYFLLMGFFDCILILSFLYLIIHKTGFAYLRYVHNKHFKLSNLCGTDQHTLI